MTDEHTKELKYEDSRENVCENCNYWYYKGIEDKEENIKNKLYEQVYKEVYEKIYQEGYQKGYEDGYDRGFHRGKNKVKRFNSWSYSNGEGVLPS